MGRREHIRRHLVSSRTRLYPPHKNLSGLRYRDTSDLPPAANITNLVGKVVLGQFNGDSEQLDLGESRIVVLPTRGFVLMHCITDNPLAQGFLLTDGHVSITVPQVADGNYIIVRK